MFSGVNVGREPPFHSYFLGAVAVVAAVAATVVAVAVSGFIRVVRVPVRSSGIDISHFSPVWCRFFSNRKLDLIAYLLER